MNYLTLAGHLGADPEVRFTSSGQKVTTLRVAARIRRGSKEDTIWWRVTIWGDQFDKMLSYFKKGSPIIVMGELNKPEIFTDRDGNPQISMGVTATNLMFSPFGRAERTSSQETSLENPLSTEAADPGNLSQEEFAKTAVSTDNSTIDDAYPADDEIPF